LAPPDLYGVWRVLFKTHRFLFSIADTVCERPVSGMRRTFECA
jgi:hypothetical protein